MNVLNLLRWLLPCCCCLRKRPNAKAIMDISQHFLQNTSQLLASPTDDYCWWSNWYRLMGLGRLNPQGLDFNKAKKGHWNIPVSKGLTLRKVMAVIDEYFTISSLNITDVRSLQTEDIRSINRRSYLISLKPNEITDCSEDNLSGKVAMTLIERLLLELYYWSLTGQHLDSNSTMSRCCGSTFQGKHLDVYWLTSLGGIIIDKATERNQWLIKKQPILRLLCSG